MKLICQIVCIFLHVNILKGFETVHFSTILNAVDSNGNIYFSEAIVKIKFVDCIDACKASDTCWYMNYHITTKTCYFIDARGAQFSRGVKRKPGYVYADKLEWYLLDMLESGGVDTVLDSATSVCPVTGCGPPIVINDTVRHGNMYHTGHKVQYECTTGYKPAVDTVSVCQEDGNWSITKLNCGCPLGWYIINHSCYKLTSVGSFDAGVAECNEHGAKPVMIDSLEENTALKALLPIMDSGSTTYNCYYTGYTDRRIEGLWKYMDSDIPLSDIDWYLEQPNGGTLENCLAFCRLYAYKWADAKCANVNMFVFKTICELPIN